ncbi:hypothetical protein ACF3MZ_13140 [Paenibacillaceae bacterium WGS1546]|uniref:hypothetical protein n=1 Tax=Cohnella sp. WGS1546 TaxID=3366810 RepID=UPI00372D55F2
MNTMDMQPLQAGFASQDQAESAVRKLSALRGDRFRLERAEAAIDLGDSYAHTADDSGMTAAVSAEGALYSGDSAAGADDRLPFGGAGSLEYTLSASIPAEALEQARTVIRQAGGRLI